MSFLKINYVARFHQTGTIKNAVNQIHMYHYNIIHPQCFMIRVFSPSKSRFCLSMLMHWME